MSERTVEIYAAVKLAMHVQGYPVSNVEHIDEAFRMTLETFETIGKMERNG